MKRIPFLLGLSLLLACNAGENTVASGTASKIDTSQNLPATAVPGLSLNDGVKWKADAKTLANISLLKSVLADALKQNPVNYDLAATALQKGLDKMVAECSMKGPDHDALHQWLLPLMKKVNELKKTSDDKAAAMLREIETHIYLFDQYFA
ncbi:MAG: hypothetical protein HYU70_10870 [Bacteroidetes bacterium]|nr:hypothetical protein [Bacteroidota bacterium]